MPTLKDYTGQVPAWCPGCGNVPILAAMKKALERTGKAKHEIVLVSGIGQAAKLPHHVDVNVFNGLHGRALPAALAIRMANPSLTVVVSSGDGDIYGEGGNHLVHNIRRNPDIAVFVHAHDRRAIAAAVARLVPRHHHRKSRAARARPARHALRVNR